MSVNFIQLAVFHRQNSLQPRPVHDGVVTVTSARHGTFLGCVPADHMDEVNQLVGDSPGLGNDFDDGTYIDNVNDDAEQFISVDRY